jgi:hypothetical protein
MHLSEDVHRIGSSASMGPRLNSRGIQVINPRVVEFDVLQWGRG